MGSGGKENLCKFCASLLRVQKLCKTLTLAGFCAKSVQGFAGGFWPAVASGLAVARLECREGKLMTDRVKDTPAGNLARAVRALFHGRGLGGLGFPSGFFRLGDAFKDFIAAVAHDHIAAIGECIAAAARARFGIGGFHFGRCIKLPEIKCRGATGI